MTDSENHFPLSVCKSSTRLQSHRLNPLRLRLPSRQENGRKGSRDSQSQHRLDSTLHLFGRQQVMERYSGGV